MSKNEKKPAAPASEPSSEPASEPAPTAPLTGVPLLIEQRKAASVSLDGLRSVISEAALSGDFDIVTAKAAEVSALASRVKVLTEAIASVTFAVNVDALLRVALNPEADAPALVACAEALRLDIPTGIVHITGVWEGGAFLGATAKEHLSPARSKGRAALSTAPKKARTTRCPDTRFPPTGIVLEACSSSSSWKTDAALRDVRVEMTETNAVRVSYADGTKASFGSLNLAACAVLGQKAVNVYKWLGLGEPGHRWNGTQG